MVTKEMLEKAKRDYPIGTVYACAAREEANVISHLYIYEVESMTWAPSPSDAIYGERGKGCLYNNGRWAKIINSPNMIYELW